MKAESSGTSSAKIAAIGCILLLHLVPAASSTKADLYQIQDYVVEFSGSEGVLRGLVVTPGLSPPNQAAPDHAEIAIKCGQFQEFQFDCLRWVDEFLGIGVESFQIVFPVPAILPALRPGDTTDWYLQIDRDLAIQRGFLRTPAPEVFLGWIGIDDVLDGGLYVEQLRAYARDQAPLDCDGKSCQMVVEAHSEGLVFEGIQVITGQPQRGLCHVTVLFSSRLSAPSECTFILLDTEKGIFVLAVQGFSSSRLETRMSALGRMDFRVEIYDSAGDLQGRVHEAVANALSGPRLNLTVVEEGEDLVGGAEYQYSDLLGKCLQHSVRAMIDEGKSDQSGRVTNIVIATSIWV